jgi:phosphatidylglycerophosphate synthase
MTMCIFARDFLVTSLRTSLMLRGAPMRTSTLAKFKTAIQMVGAGYIIFYLAVHLADPDHWITWLAICVPTLVPLSLIVYRLIARKKQGLRSWSMLALMIVAIAIRRVFDADVTSYILLLAITGITVYSGVSYLADAWGALKGAPGGIKEAGRFVLDGLLVPMAFLALLGRFEMPGLSAAIITAFSLELSAGGLANVLASHKVVPRFRWLALKSLLLVAFAGAALLVWKLNLFEGLPVGEALTLAACGVSVGYTVLSFWRRRRIYLAEIRKPSAPAA